VEFGELIEVIKIRSSACSMFSISSNYARLNGGLTSFDRVEFLASGPEMESLDMWLVVC
jgi:hypothetical protein